MKESSNTNCSSYGSKKCSKSLRAESTRQWKYCIRKGSLSSLFLIYTLLFLEGDIQQNNNRFFVHSFSTSSPSPRSRKPKREAAELVVERQLKYLQNYNNIKKAYECFDWFGQMKLGEGGDWEIFDRDLRLSTKDTDEFKPLVQHCSATVLVVMQEPDPHFCRCLVRLVMPEDYDNDGDNDGKIINHRLKRNIIPLYYWWGLRLEELVETEEYGTIIKEKPDMDVAVWKVEGIIPDNDYSVESAAIGIGNIGEGDEEASLYITDDENDGGIDKMTFGEDEGRMIILDEDSQAEWFFDQMMENWIGNRDDDDDNDLDDEEYF